MGIAPQKRGLLMRRCFQPLGDRDKQDRYNRETHSQARTNSAAIGSSFFSGRDLPGSSRKSHTLRSRIWCSGCDFNTCARLHLFCIILRVRL